MRTKIKSTLMVSACSSLLMAVAGGLTVSSTLLMPTLASAQDYTTGSILGTATADDGAPVANAKVTVRSDAQGVSRELTTNADGQFTVSLLPPGEYVVTVSASGYNTTESQVSIVVSQEVRYSFAMQTVAADAQVVVVKAKGRRNDFAKNTTGVTLDLESLTRSQPIARNVTAVAMLAPTVTMGNPAYSSFSPVASFGGASVAENAFYVDGLNITNPDTYIGGAEVPFDFYKTIEVKTGGYPAEFGRATGGVVNAVTKSGTNEFMFAIHGNYQSADMRARQKDTYGGRGKFEERENNSLSVEAGGALIKDRLFAYGLYQFNDITRTDALYRSSLYNVTKNDKPFMGAKIDGFITPDHRLSLTWFDATSSYDTESYKYTDATQTIGAHIPLSTLKQERGGKSYVVNYSGKITDAFSISAAAGRMEDRLNDLPANTSDYYVSDARSGSSVLLSKGQSSTATQVTEISRDFVRFDGDLRFQAMGRHHLRFGYDSEKNAEEKVRAAPGAGHATLDYALSPIDGVSSVLHYRYLVWGGSVSSENTAFYVQDSWDVTPTLNLQIGVRNDNFKQFNLQGEQYLDLKNNLAPRLGFSWDPTGEGRWKVFGSVGSNYIPPAMSLGFRGRDLDFEQYLSAPAGGFVIDPTTGLPAAVGSPIAVPDQHFDSPCPTGSTLTAIPGFQNALTGNTCNVHSPGVQEPANAKAAFGLKATRDDEVILGATFTANELWTFGARYTQRNLNNISEDSDFSDAIQKYFVANGINPANYPAVSGYHVWNAGDHGVTIRLQGKLAGENEQRVITLTADQLGHYHNPKRNYQALVFDFKRTFDGKWGLQGSYTLARSYGNYEGTVKSDVGNTVQDTAGATIAYDSPGFEDYGTGLLANDRTHTLKLWGSYAVTENFSVGANVMIQSPAHFSCLGYHPTDGYAGSYGPFSHYCDGKPAPLGKGLKSDWTKNVDVALRYTMPKSLALGGDLVLRADIFNLFDTHSIVTRRVTYETSGVGVHSSVYGMPTNYNAPRTVRIGFDLSY